MTAVGGPSPAAGLAGALTAVAVGGSAWAVGVEPRWFALRVAEAPVLRPAARGPLSVLHLSDLHLQPRGRLGKLSRADALARFLERCHAPEPDLTVITGDLVGHPAAIDDAVALLAPLVAERPGLVTLGSNDRYGPVVKNPLGYLVRGDASPAEPEGEPIDTEALVRGLASTGWTVAENTRVRVDTAAGPVEAAGLGDAHLGADRPGRVDWRAPAADAALYLGVAHAPYARVLDQLAGAGCDLALCGHTHGGQVRVPGVGALTTNCDLPTTQARGLSRWQRMPLHVSAGLGQSRYAPFRFACRPEATLLRLHAPA